MDLLLSRRMSSSVVSSLCRVAALSCIFFACGGNSSSREVPPVTRLPEGGQLVEEPVTSSVPDVSVDAAGVLWLASCEGLYARTSDGIYRYTWLDNGFVPEGRFAVYSDTDNRTWLQSELGLTRIEGGQAREVLERDVEYFTLGADGSAWVQLYDSINGRARLRQVAPRLGEEIDAPIHASSFTVSRDGAVWVAGIGEVYRWDGRWSGPFSLPGGGVQYDPTIDRLWVASAGVFEWTGEGLTQGRGAQRLGRFVGVTPDGVLVTADGRNRHEYRDGELQSSRPLGPSAALAMGPDGSVYVASADDVRVSRGGDSENVTDLVRFDPALHFPWRAQGFGAALRAPSLDVGRGELDAADASRIGDKVRFPGRVYSGFEFMGMSVAGAALRANIEPSQQVSGYAANNGIEFITSDPNEGQLGAPPLEIDGTDTSISGYLEVGSCFGREQNLTRNFWIVEDYPNA